jgi:glycosyltransferase involved in cell wall biosynthesis
MSMDVVYAVNSDVGKGGTGTAALHDAQALQKAGMLQRLLCRSHEKGILPEDKVKNVFPGGRHVSRAISALSYYGGGVFPSQYANDILFDRACGKFVKDCDVFAAWNMPLRAERIAQHHNAIAIKHAGSSHPLTRKAIADAEFRRRRIMMPLSLLSFRREQKEFAIADHMVVPSDFIKQSYVEHGVDAKRVHVVQHGVDIDRFTPTDMPDGTFTALFVGQIQHRKGVLDLLDAWEQAALPDARLVLGGVVQPELRKVVAAYQKELGNIVLPGFIDPALGSRKRIFSLSPPWRKASLLS